MGVIGYPGRVLPQGGAINLGVQNPSTAGTQQVSANFPSLVKSNYGALPVTMPACSLFLIPPGNFAVLLGQYTFLQVYDANGQYWRIHRSPYGVPVNVSSDGVNFRLANLTGSVVSGVITNSGSGYTSAPTCTPNAGGATFRCVLGSAINTSVTITAAGTLYTLPPVLVIDPPPAGGIQATATCTISAGAVNAVTVTNQGAGYSSTPKITVVAQPGDTTGSGAILTAALITSAGVAGAADTVCAIVPVTPGTARTTVPTLAFSGGGGASAAATAIMCWTATSATSTGLTHGSNGGMALINSALTAGSATLTNPAISTGLIPIRMGFTEYRADLSTATVAAPALNDGGIHQAAAGAVGIINSDGTISGSTTWAVAMGGVSDGAYLLLLD